MFEPKSAFSGFSVDSSVKAREFYSTTLGLEVTKHGYGTRIHLPGGAVVFFYPKGAAHKPTTYTTLNLVVDNIDEAVETLKARGIEFDAGEHTDEKGIQRGIASGMGPDQAWFKDPAGNIISVLKEAS
jgi:catechol 2,3-dioxygenase-like lactoylglutathione lyase family enzyme